jgi:oligogalacturonide lyase
MSSHVRHLSSALILLAAFSPLAHPQSLPTTWVDKDTGHRVYRLTDEPGSSAFYFNVNDYTPDGKELIYTAPDGIHVLTLATKKTRLLVPNPPRPADDSSVVVGHKTPTVFYTQPEPGSKPGAITVSVYKADINTGKIQKLTTLPQAPTLQPSTPMRPSPPAP